MRRADGRAFVVDASGSAEITEASSTFLRALVSAGTAPPRAENTSTNATTERRAIPAWMATEEPTAVDEPLMALVPAVSPSPAPAQEPSRPVTRSTSRREYFPRATRLYEALTGGRRRREPAAPPPAAPAVAPAERRLSLDDRHVGEDAVGIRRRRRRLEGRFLNEDVEAPLRREASRAGADATGADATGADGTGTGAGTGLFTLRRPDGSLDIARVARELGESLQATRSAVDEDNDAERYRGGGNLRTRVAFLADALLTILREVDARLLAEANDDGSGLPGLLGFGASADARDLDALPATTIYGGRDVVSTAGAGSASGGDVSVSDPPTRSYAAALSSPPPSHSVAGDPSGVAASSAKAKTPLTFYGACGYGCGDDSDTPQCYICLEEFVSGEEIRELPCRHAFHRACVDTWLLRSSRKCPTCRAEVPRVPRGRLGEDRDTGRDVARAWRVRGAEVPTRLALPRPNQFFLPAPASAPGVGSPAIPETA